MPATSNGSRHGCELIEESDLLISPVVLLELQYLHEIERLTIEPGGMYENLASAIGIAVCDLPMMRVITATASNTKSRPTFSC